MNLFGFWTSEAELVNEIVSEESSVSVETISKELVSSWAWEVLVSLVLFLSIFFAYFFKKFA